MELLERFAVGNIDAFESVFRQFQSEVYGWIVRIVRDPAAAEDLTIETFWRIYRSRSRFDPRRGFGAWARRIAMHVAFSHLKSTRHEAVLLGETPDPRPTPHLPADGVHAAVRLAFSGLPPRLRSAAALALIEERPYADVADALGISVAAVKSRVFRAVRLLRKSLKRMGVEP